MEPWGRTGNLFEAGLDRDPSGRGAGWARIAVAERITDPSDALECAGRAVASNPQAWGPWYVAFVAPPFEAGTLKTAALTSPYPAAPPNEATTADGLVQGPAFPFDRLIAAAVHRLAGLGLVFVSVALFYLMTIPGGRGWEYAILGALAICGTFCGLPLLVTGRIRQRP